MQVRGDVLIIDACRMMRNRQLLVDPISIRMYMRYRRSVRSGTTHRLDFRAMLNRPLGIPWLYNQRELPASK